MGRTRFGHLAVAGVIVLAALCPLSSEAARAADLEVRGIARILTAEADGRLSDWFLAKDFWESQLEVMETAGLNFLELRGVYRLDDGTYVNLFPYLVIEPSQRYVHRPDEEVSANRKMLKWIVQEAVDRGIRVALVTAGFDVEPSDLVDPLGLEMTRVDRVINFDWVGEAPAKGFEIDDFAVRWAGYVNPPMSGEYTFITEADDGTRLWIGNHQLIDDWGRMHGILEKNGRTYLEAGRRYPIRLDYLELKYAAVVRLLWQPPSGERQIIPREYLEPSEGEGQGLTGEYFSRRAYSRKLTARSAQDIIRRVPDLAFIGFDPGFDAKAAEDGARIYPSLLEKGPGPSLLCHARGSSAESLNRLSARLPGRVTVLADWNGDQLGLPYPALRDHDPTRLCLQDPGERNWRLVWRMGGATHRLFSWLEPEFIRACINNTSMFGGKGFVWEPIGCYGAQDCARIYRVPESEEPPWRWLHQRDALTYRGWGLFASDPEAEAGELRREFQRTVGGDEKDAGEFYDEVLTCLSRVLPAVTSVHCVGLGVEEFAPELETGNDGRGIDQFIHVPSMDHTRIHSIAEAVRARIEGKPSGKVDPLKESLSLGISLGLDCVMPEAESAGGVLGWMRKDFLALQQLGRYYTAKIAAAHQLETYYQSGCVTWLEQAERSAAQAADAWERLATITDRHFQPLIEPSRMHTTEFSWARGRKELENDLKRLSRLREEIEEVSGLVIRHAPVFRAEPGEVLILQCTVLGDESAEVFLEYRGGNHGGRIKGSAASRVWTIAGEEILPGTLGYRFAARTANRHVSWPFRGFHVVRITEDREGPAIEAVATDEGVLKIRARDKGARIESVGVSFFPLSTGRSIEWISREIPMEEEGLYRVPLPGDSCVWWIEARDRVGNVTRWPEGDASYRLSIR